MLVLEFKSNVCTVIQYFWVMKETFCVLSGFVETLRSLKLEKKHDGLAYNLTEFSYSKVF